MGPVSCVSCVSWMYWLNGAETHETFHWASGMRYQFSILTSWNPNMRSRACVHWPMR